ncbi:hydroxymyristoyl-ACP dehydratase [Enterobacterales bacterium CwR94]|nr:hydroxymyristoyl-ACP dehydratase [Enterobacterales bacterium CwR94]
MRAHENAIRQPTASQAEIELTLNPSLFWFQGHFSVQPLLPGVAQLDWVMHYARQLLVPAHQFHSIQNVKFQAPLLPDNRVLLTLNWDTARQHLQFSYQRQAADGSLHTASSGKLRLCL